MGSTPYKKPNFGKMIRWFALGLAALVVLLKIYDKHTFLRERRMDPQERTVEEFFEAFNELAPEGYYIDPAEAVSFSASTLRNDWTFLLHIPNGSAIPGSLRCNVSGKYDNSRYLDVISLRWAIETVDVPPGTLRTVVTTFYMIFEPDYLEKEMARDRFSAITAACDACESAELYELPFDERYCAPSGYRAHLNSIQENGSTIKWIRLAV